ncbi:CNNM domain-containing protein [Corynebacterium guangdongense]|uniref:CBS domain containing-hemolysin-like protein n=1 Tax=Corynebacterium guangdongense TaxID=1783348 RepID=A0ABU1ZYG3_9CORY|nr:hemolysin family protein [Corynebacterium guangdongense]MDR7329979.1 CBS domain containing-hemolysin-like protein [Corynebacterium guangdongense]WJZ18537.1 CBS domain protein [Corynebacterium guangdongense]
MVTWYIALPATVLIIAASAFFVVIEFSLLSARRHRLEEQAETSRSARAGLRGLNELTIMLAGAQLGITAATFALGAITEPWVHHLLLDLFGAVEFVGALANVLAFALALFVVTFLHLVIGEMAPKSWAIAHPEPALRIVAVPARWFVTVFRPLLLGINSTANRLVRAAGEEPVDRAAAKGYDAETLHHLVGHSADTGTLDRGSAREIQGVIRLKLTPVGEAVAEYGSPVEVLPSGATVADVQRRARDLGSLRVLLDDPDSGLPVVVHVRDTVTLAPQIPARGVATTPLMLEAGTEVQELLDAMREHNEQLALVVDEPGELMGVLTWDDIMNRLWPEIQRVTGAEESPAQEANQEAN